MEDDYDDDMLSYLFGRHAVWHVTCRLWVVLLVGFMGGLILGVLRFNPPIYGY